MFINNSKQENGQYKKKGSTCKNPHEKLVPQANKITQPKRKKKKRYQYLALIYFQ